MIVSVPGIIYSRNALCDGFSEWVIVAYRQFSTFSAISWREQVNFQWDDDEVHFVLDQYADLDFYSASSLKQQSADRHVNKSFNINKTSSHLSSQIIEHIKDHLHDVGNACPGLGSKHSRIKLVNRIPTLLSCIYICTI